MIITWSPGLDGGHAQTFIVNYRAARASRPTWSTFGGTIKEDDDRLSVLIIGLQPNTEYVGQIIAKNTEGENKVSFVQTTKGTNIITSA